MFEIYEIHPVKLQSDYILLIFLKFFIEILV